MIFFLHFKCRFIPFSLSVAQEKKAIFSFSRIFHSAEFFSAAVGQCIAEICSQFIKLLFLFFVGRFFFLARWLLSCYFAHRAPIVYVAAMQLDFHWLVEDEYEAFILTFLAFILILLSPYKAIQNAFNVFHRFGRYFAPVLVLLLMVMLFFSRLFISHLCAHLV